MRIDLRVVSIFLSSPGPAGSNLIARFCKVSRLVGPEAHRGDFSLFWFLQEELILADGNRGRLGTICRDTPP